METVMNTGLHVIDLDDGRQLAPGESAEGVALDKLHNKSLLDDGQITVVNTTPAEPPAEPPRASRAHSEPRGEK